MPWRKEVKMKILVVICDVSDEIDDDSSEDENQA